MSTAPTGWQTPKTNWQAADAVGPGDLNRIEQNVSAIEAGARTLDPALAGAANAGTLRQILSWMAGRIKAITGAANWFDTPAATIAAIWGKFSQSTGHKHTGAANDGPPIPLSGIDSAAKTGAGGTEASRLAVTGASGGVGRADALRDAGGEYRGATTPGGYGANAAYRAAVADANGRVGDANRLGGLSSDLAATANTIMKRDAAGRAKVATPIANDDIARLDTVEGLKNSANTFAQRQTFQTGIQDGDGNQDVSFVKAAQLETHTRTTVLGYTGDDLTSVEDRDGATVVKATALSFTNGVLTGVSETANGVTTTQTLIYTNGVLTSIERS